ncbi:MAG: CRISPR system precrRNA processing endoribonuclease RAMP protein Cas6 [Deltaproteobacteria bacterium]|nr:CRISPR system precrRNA processing endoribonuclease RAMP protein Cas6 [Deltaproteobacteria bacterium]
MDAKEERFPILPLRFEIKAKTSVEIPPFAGSTLRGALGVALKRICCISKQRACDECLIRSSCVYVYLFETTMLGDSFCDPRFRNAPHPFVLVVPVAETNTLLNPGDTWSFGITVFGRAVTWLPYFVAAVERMGQIGIGRGRGKFELERLWSLDEKGNPVELLYNEEGFRFPEKFLSLESLGRGKPGEGNGKFRLTFLTPLRIRFRGKLVDIPEFHIVMGNLLKRISLLMKFHAEGDFPDLSDDLIRLARGVNIIENNTSWYDWVRYSHRQGLRMRLGGIVGDVVYEGDPSLFEPYISAGTILHIGKNTGFGLGRYRWEYV